MEYDMILPAMAGASGLFAGCAVLYSKIRPHFPVKVNCWFCNTDTKVEFRYRDSWVCPACSQYNGFTEDGGYNCDIPEQYCETLNTPLNSSVKKPSKQHGLAHGNGLCQTCNLNQTFKIRALADYTPVHPNNYDKEIEEYRKRLETSYALCRQCEATLHQTLGKQDSWLKPKLISWRLHLTSENKARLFNNVPNRKQKTAFYIHLLHMIGILISVALFLSNMHHLQQDSGIQLVSLDFGMAMEVYLTTLYKFSSPLIIAGLSMLLMSIFGSGKEYLQVSDAITSFLWVGLLALCSSKQLIPPKDYNSLQVLISGAAAILTLWTSFVPRNLNSTIVQMKPRLNKSVISETVNSTFEDSRRTVDASFSDDTNCLTPQSSPSPHQRRVTVTPAQPSIHKVPTATDDLDTTLGSLKISTPLRVDVRNHSSTPFSPKLLFSEKPGYNPKLNDTFCSQRSSTNASRLSAKNITQSSWVAGGYWGHPVSSSREFSQHVVPTLGSSQSSMYPLSRSSSQSSGFVSQSSGPPPYKAHGPFSLPNSRHGSHCGDFDRGSLLSEPTYKTWGYAPSVYPSDSASQYGYSQCQGQAKGDGQSLYSCKSAVDCSLQRTPSPTASNSCIYHTTLGNLSENSSDTNSHRNMSKVQAADAEFKKIKKKNLAQGYRNPWIAFFLGMSIAANGFLAAILYLNTDIQALFGS